jgi:LemA protein
MGNGMKVGLAVGAAVLLAVGVAVSGYNRVIGMDEGVKEKWAQVENQLKRRYDLIPNLVETVKGYATHERELFEHIADARTKYFSAGSVGEKIQASNQLEGVLSRLLLLQENYPQLKANENFLKLQDSLEGTENRIAVERMRYNETVRTLNAYIRGFPGRLWAGFAGVQQAAYYDLPAGQEETPQVRFN